jgi:glycerophosphoryl diester phosphodiesterase
MTPLPEIIAHRGASAYAPENTVAAFDLALQQGADALELDVRVTADGELVLVHDATLLRTTGDPRSVDSLTAGALAALHAGTRPPRLEDVLTRYAGRTRFVIDLKDPTPSWEHRVVAAIERHGLQGRAIVQSFDGEALRRVHAGAPWLTVVPLYRRSGPRPHDVLRDAATFAGGIAPWQGWVDAALVHAARAHGLAVRPWTLDHPDDLERMVALGVDGVISNAPDVAVDVTRRLGRLPAAA